MEKSVFVRRIDAGGPVRLEDVPAMMDSLGVPRLRIDCDRWKCSDRNPSVSAGLAHDGGNIFLHFHIRDNEVRATESRDDARVWEDSCCEFFISPDCDGTYYNIECSCIGALLLHFGVPGDRPAAPAEVTSSVRRWSSLGREPFGLREGDCEWDLVEIIPAGAFFRHAITDLGGLEMTCNLYKCGDKLSHPHYLSWAPIECERPMFHCPQFFGRIVFE